MAIKKVPDNPIPLNMNYTEKDKDAMSEVSEEDPIEARKGTF